MHWPATFCPLLYHVLPQSKDRIVKWYVDFIKSMKTLISEYMKFCILIGANTLGIHFLPLHCIEGIDLDKEEGNCIFLSFNLFFILQTMIKKKRHNSYQSGLYVKSSLIQNHIGCMYNKHFYLNIFKIGIPNIPPKVTFSYSLHHLSFWQFPPNQFFRSITLVSSFIALFSKQLPQIYLQNLAALPLNYI